jgi:probable phosphoglycerate mutase
MNEKLNEIHFDYVFSSPQERAVQTAEIVAGVSPIIDDRLNVYDLGTADNLKKEDVDSVNKNSMPSDTSKYQGMEDIDHYISRIFSFMNDIKDKFKNKPVNILIVGHKCTTGCVSAFFEGMPENKNFLKYSLGNCQVKSYNFRNQEQTEIK